MPVETIEAKTSTPRPLGFWKKLLFGGVVCLAFFALLELVLWLAGVSTRLDAEDPFHGFSGLISVFQRDGDTFRTRVSTVGDVFNEQSFLVEKPKNGLRIFSMGGSSTYGFPWGAGPAFTNILGEAIARGHPDLYVEAVNVGGISYAMHRVNIVADELLQYDADVFIVYSGHNEFIEPAFYEALKSRSSEVEQFEYVLAHSRTYSGMRSLLDRMSERQREGLKVESQVDLEGTKDYTEEEKQTVIADYRWGLERLVRRAKAAGVHVVLTTVPCNLSEWRPNASAPLLTLDDQQRKQWLDAFTAGKRQFEAAQFEAAGRQFQEAAKLAPDHAETQYLLGQALAAQDRWDEARGAFQMACDSDASPNRRLSAINQVVHDVGQQYDVLVADMDQIFATHGENGQVGAELIEDFVHPTRKGHELIAFHIWETIARSGLLGDNDSADPELFEQVAKEIRQRPIKKNAAWFFNQGVVLENQGRREDAIEKYHEALEVSPDHVGTLANLGTLLTNVGRAADAIPFLEKAVALDPELDWGHNNLASALQQLGQYELAEVNYRKVLKLKPDVASTHNNLGNALIGQGRATEALQHYEEALKLDPRFVLAHNNLGFAKKSLQRYDEAIKHFQDALRLKPDHDATYVNLGDTYRSMRLIDQAIEHYTEATSLNPHAVPAHLKLGVALQGLGRLKDAVPHYERVLALEPNNAAARSNLGFAHLMLGDFKAALKHSQAAVMLEPDNAQFHSNVASTLEGSGQFIDAVSHYEEALRLNPESAETQNNLGNTFMRHGRHLDAVRCYKAAVRLRADYFGAQSNLALSLLALKRLPKAAAAYERALRLKPDFIAGHLNAGQVYQRLNEFDSALKHYSNAIALNPKIVNAYVNRSLVYRKLDEDNKALRDLDRAIQLSPEQPVLYVHRGTLLRELGQAELALTDFDKAIQLQPAAAQVYYNRGEIYKLWGEDRLAIADFRTAVRLNPDFAAALNDLAWLLATSRKAELRDGQQAVMNARRACEILGWDNSGLLDTLASAYAETGDFSEAVKWQTEAIILSADAEKADLQSRLEFYKSKKPFHQPARDHTDDQRE